jgi:hypothetical protein
MKGNQTKVKENEDKFFEQQTTLNNQLKATTFSYNHGDKFYREYSDFVSQLTSTFEHLQAFCQQNLTNYAHSQEEAKAKAAKDLNFSNQSDEFIKAKTDDLIKKNKFLDELKSKMKDCFTPITAKKMAALKVKETPSLTNFFTVVFQTFYKDSKETFDWAKFKAVAFKSKNFDDFPNRLVNADFANFTQEQIDNLVKFREDQGLNEYAKNKKEGEPILHLINYLEFVSDVNKTQNDLTRLHDEITRIKADAPNRKDNAKVEASWGTALQENITYLDALNSRLVKSAEQFGDEVKRTNEMADNYEQHKNQLRQVINQEFTPVKNIPQTIYNA